MSNSVDITGLLTGKLVALKESHKEGRHWLWECRCECGQIALFPNRYIRLELVSNCGKCASSTRKNAAYIGDVASNTEGYSAKIVGFLSPKEYQIKFEDKYEAIITVAPGNLKRGHFANPYHASVAGVGYFGIGRFIAKSGGKHTIEYADWNSMLKRCYVSRESKLSYKDKSVCEDWHCFQNFAEWATKQINFGKEGWDLEKDLLIKNNKVYSPDTCVYLPREINSFIKRKRVNNLPLGVDVAYKYNGTPYFRVQAREEGKNICLGGYTTAEEAFSVYKEHKEGLAHKLAEKWKKEIPDVAYKALLNYTVEITD